MIQLNHLLVFIGLFFTSLISAQTIALPTIGESNIYNSVPNVASNTETLQLDSAGLRNTGIRPVFIYLSIGGGSGLSANASIEVLFGKNYSVSLYTDGSSQKSPLIPGDYTCGLCFFGSNARQTLRTHGIRIGKIIPTSNPLFRLNMKTGLGISMYDRPENFKRQSPGFLQANYSYDIKKTSVASLIFQPMFEFIPSRFVGIGLGATVHINKYTTFFGVHGNLQLGYLRKKIASNKKRNL